MNEEETAKLTKLVAALAPGQNTRAGQMVVLYTALLDEMVVDVALQMHRSLKTDSMCMECFEEEQSLQKNRTIRHKVACSKFIGHKSKPTHDIYGLAPPSVNKDNVKCFECSQEMAASRFAPHLEKCFGNGRNSRRPARAKPAPGTYNDNKPVSPELGPEPPKKKAKKGPNATPLAMNPAAAAGPLGTGSLTPMAATPGLVPSAEMALGAEKIISQALHGMEFEGIDDFVDIIGDHDGLRLAFDNPLDSAAWGNDTPDLN